MRAATGVSILIIESSQRQCAIPMQFPAMDSRTRLHLMGRWFTAIVKILRWPAELIRLYFFRFWTRSSKCHHHYGGVGFHFFESRTVGAWHGISFLVGPDDRVNATPLIVYVESCLLLFMRLYREEVGTSFCSSSFHDDCA